MEPIKTIQTKDYIAKLLREEIISGNMKDGEELTQELIAEKLGVSRMPVREALQLLENEGFLTRLPNRHIRVNGIKAENIKHYLSALIAIEIEIAIMLIQENKDISAIEAVYENYRNIDSYNNYELCIEMEIAFHTQISIQLNDIYIEKIHIKMLNSFFSIMLNKLQYNFENSKQRLESILKNLRDKDIDNLRNNFYLYYTEKIKEVKLGELK